MMLTDDEIDALWEGKPSLPQIAVRRWIARKANKALLEKLRGGVELPEPVAILRTKETVRVVPMDAAYDMQDGDYKLCTVEAAIQYGDARALAAREREGWKWVPVEPTDEMEMAWDDAHGDGAPFHAMYASMLAASPQEQA